MEIQTYVYFLIVLSGFGLVWGFRKGRKSKNNISDFEYLAFSMFWGVLVYVCFQWMLNNNPVLFSSLISNPLSGGVVMSFFSGLFGSGVGWLSKILGIKQ